MTSTLRNKQGNKTFSSVAYKILYNDIRSLSDSNINQMLDALLASTTLTTANEQDLIDLLVSGCKTINYADEHFVLKFSKIIFIVCNKHQINLNGNSSRQSPLEVILTFLINSLPYATQPSSEINILRTLSAVLFENGTKCQKFHESLCHLLFPLVRPDNPNLETRRMAINCLGNLCMRTGNKLNGKYKDIYEIFLANLNSMTIDDTASLKVVSSTLRALQLVVIEDKNVLVEPFGAVVETIKRFVFFNFDGSREEASMRDQMLPTQMLRRQSASTPKSRPLRQMEAGTHSRNNSKSWISSDSELSDGDHFHQRKTNDGSRIRLNALGCLQAIARAAPKLLHPHWTKFLSDMHSVPTSPSLFTLIAHDTVQTVRIAACSAIMIMLDGSKKYLSVADDRDTKSSFTSLSAKLGGLVRELHTELIKTIALEEEVPVLVQLLKCGNVLVTNTAYERLSSGYLSRLFRAVVSLLAHEDTSIRISTLTLLSSIISCNSRHDEVLQLLEGKVASDSSSTSTLLHSSSLYNKTLLQYLIETVGDNNQPSNVRIEAWGLLCGCARGSFINVNYLWSQLEVLITNGMGTRDISIRTAAMTFMEECAKASSSGSNIETTERLPVIESKPPVSSDELLHWWRLIIDNHINKAATDECHAVRALSCDCLSHIPDYIFAELPDDRRYYCMTFLLGFVQDDSPIVRAAACRAFGVFIQFPSLHEDTSFITDMAVSIFEQISNTNLMVRMRSSWALGNLCDTLVNLSSDAERLMEFLTEDIWIRLLRAGLAASNDNDKVRPNGVRILGSVLRIGPKTYLMKEHNGLVREAVLMIIKNFEYSSLKVRWNACYAAANMLRNVHLPISSDTWANMLYEALIKAMTSAKNFKVRINASLALSSPVARDKYGNQQTLAKVFEAVVYALENVESMAGAGFQEFKYQEQLRMQLISTYDHLSGLLNEGEKAQYQSLIDRIIQSPGYNKVKNDMPEI
ncbi:2678_t:CDS:10 [Paraglomus brasilianum]|uniref:2678_t:CDS:1 n=1 Tax=Paraglomus brasilianum TaxID=144538 RepID=A0A9N8VZS5_9GLOM|nr:2678_t:CDS:10 [Paraglomus brasilianum]